MIEQESLNKRLEDNALYNFFSKTKGFQTSSVYWDDEDEQNQNSHGGTLPSGVFDYNTRIYYCCRYG